MCSPKQRALLRKVYPRGTWDEILAAFPGYSRQTIYAWATQSGVLRLRRDRSTANVDPLVATLITARMEQDISPKALAHKLGVSLNALYMWERGQCAPRDFRTLHAWAKALGLAIKLEPLP